MHLTLAIVLVVLTSVMLLVARDMSRRLPIEDRAVFKKRGFWSPAKRSGWPQAVVWSLLNLSVSLLLFHFLVEPDRPFVTHPADPWVSLAFATFIVVVIGAITISRYDFYLKFFVPICISAIFWAALLLTSSYIIPFHARMPVTFHALIERPGTIFVAILGFITITGFIVTISQLQETNARITDYPTLLKRLAYLIGEAVALQTNGASKWLVRITLWLDRRRGMEVHSEDPVRIYVRTLALGSMSTPPQIFRRYEHVLANLLAHGRSIIAQLDHSNLPSTADLNDEAGLRSLLSTCAVGRLYLHFFSRGFDAIKVSQGFQKARDLGMKAHDQAKYANHTIISRPEDAGFPSYHLYLSARRAIVIMALDLPIGTDDINEKWNLGSVHVVAVETTNPLVISELIQTFDVICKKCNPPIAPGPSTPDAISHED